MRHKELLLPYVVSCRLTKYVVVNAAMMCRRCQTDGGTGFLRAARAGNIDKVLEYLSNSIDIDVCNAVSTSIWLNVHIDIHMYSVFQKKPGPLPTSNIT